MGCLGCGSEHLEPLLSVRQSPVHSTMLFDDAESAHAIRRADIDLAYCHACGLISNTAFDPGLLSYGGDGFEESQFASPTFRAYAERLARKLVERSGAGGGAVTELGCGRAEFLSALCEAGASRGTGIDPAAGLGRLDDVANSVELITEFYGEGHAPIIRASRLVCCRHTLEHIHDPTAFLGLLSKHLEAHPDVAVYFDVPDTEHVLDEGGFWELNYEHCCNFTAQSLACTFERAGFAVREVTVDYGGQNLGVHADSGPASGGAASPDAAAEERARAFADASRNAIAAWTRALTGRGGTVLWGSGSRAVGFMGATGLGDDDIAGIVDINERRQGRYMPGYGRPIIAPQALPDLCPARVVVMNPMYREEIAADLERVGVSTEVLAVNDPPA